MTLNSFSTTSSSTLSGPDYCSEDVFDLEKERIFHRGWCFLSTAAAVPAGTKRVVRLAGEDVILSRDRHGKFHTMANTCRHRGATLCEPTEPTELSCAGPQSIQCPYHAWTYSLDGRLLSTPRVDAAEVDRDTSGLWQYRVAVWNGLVFVCMSAETEPLEDYIAAHSPNLLQFSSIPIADLHLTERTVTEVAANWKIIIENYKECLHCPIVHPELVDLIPVYKTGDVVDHDRADGSVELSGGGISFSESGTAPLPVIPGLADGEETVYRGTTVFPNMFLDVTGTSVIITAMFPTSATTTTVVGEYLFAPEVADSQTYDTSDVVEFSELVFAQDNVVCELVQTGVASKSFTSGILTSKDAGIAAFIDQYLALRDS